MPYFITDQSAECEAWAVVKDDGELMACHPNKQSAIDQMLAISLAEGIEPGGTYEGRRKKKYKEKRAGSGPLVIISDIDGTLVTGGRRNQKVWDFIQSEDGSLYIVTGRPESARDRTERLLARLDITYSRLIMNDGSTANSPEFKKQTVEELLKTHSIDYAIENDETTLGYYRDLGIDAMSPSEVDSEDEPDDDSDEEMNQDDSESRAVNLEPPAFMRAAARRGIQLYEEGKAGDGLVRRTVDEARAMAAGNVTRDKWVRIAAWIARHMPDLDAPKNSDRSHPEYPGPGLVAHLLWGSGPSKRQAMRAMEYAQGVVDRLKAEDERGITMAKRETRNFDADFEIRQKGDGMTFVGYAAKFNSRSENLGGFVETIMPGAFKRSLRSRNDVKLLVNHDAGRVLASTRAGTLRLKEDSVGLRVEADLPNTTDGRDMAELLRRGDLSSMSFGFSVIKDSWSSDGTERSLESVRLFETSIVAFPAYQATEASVRAYEQLATRANVDADDLADAILKLEEGEDLNDEQAKLLKDVVEKLTPAKQEEPVVVQEEPNILELKRKQLELILKRV